jgi:hypothetical protein
MASQENVQKSETLLSRLSEDAVERNRKFQQWNDTMAARLQELRNKITQARHAANGVCKKLVFVHFIDLIYYSSMIYRTNGE